MSQLREFRLPDVGEGLTEADIVSWHVKPGDAVTDGQIIVEIETAKAVVELPTPFTGTVARLLVEEGQTVDVGAPIITVDTSGGGAGGAAESGVDAGADPAAEALAADAVPAAPAAPARQPVLVGYGVKEAPTTRRPRRPQASEPKARAAAWTDERRSEAEERGPASDPEGAASPGLRSDAPASEPKARAAAWTDERRSEAEERGGKAAAQSAPEASERIREASERRQLAKPPVRKLAKDLGVSLAELDGTGPAGSITRDDVQRAATSAARRYEGTEERIPVKGVRKHMAAAMVASAFTAPHVTEFLQVDVTETMEAVRRVRELPEFAGVRVSPLLFVARALLVAVARYPLINSSWAQDDQEIVVHRQVNLGIAVASERGLIVPNVKDAGSLPLPALAAALHELTETARSGKSTPADLSGGTITITNVGVFGVDAGTPILTPGEAAILAFGQVKDAPWVIDGQLAVRKVCTLSLSFDHRIIDGELGSAALRDVGSMLTDPVRLLAWS